MQSSKSRHDLFQEQVNLLFNSLNVVAESRVFLLQQREPLPEVLQFPVAPPLGCQLRAVQPKALDVKASRIGERS